MDGPRDANLAAAAADPGTGSADIGAASVDPDTSHVDPNAAPASSNTTPASPDTASASSNAAPTSPDTGPADPSAASASSSTAHVDPHAAPVDPNTASAKPSTDSAYPSTTSASTSVDLVAASAGRDGPTGRVRLRAEVLIVLGLSLGQSGVYAAINLAAKLTAGRPLAQQTATLNASQSPRPYLDLTYQLVGIAFTLVPVALALWLLSANRPNVVRLLGLNRYRPLRDLAYGLGLAALIGLPGLALYFIGRELGITATIVPAALDPHWWTVPVLILQAAKNAVLEEVIVVGYLVTRLKELGWRAPAVVGASAVLRGSYHLYQGFGPFIGNAVMGVIFAEWFRRGGRVMPLIIAHTVLDVVSFVGYDLFGGVLGLK